MQLPLQSDARLKLIGAIRHMKGDSRFDVFMDWIRDELKQRDAENRKKGLENQLSEAQALESIVDIVTACQLPEANRDSSESGKESESAAPIM